MPRLHGWRQDTEDTSSWSYGGSNFVADMWGPSINDPANPNGFEVRIWPRLGDVDSNDPTKPLGPTNGGLLFPDEATARAYIESWERAVGR
jgi:hypothetical protein